MVGQDEGVTKNSQEQGRQEIPERRASRSTRNVQGDGDGKSKHSLVQPPGKASLAAIREPRAQEGALGNKNGIDCLPGGFSHVGWEDTKECGEATQVQIK